MAPSSFILMALLSLAVVSGITEARMAPIGQHKNLQSVGKDVTVAEAIENIMQAESSTRDCHTSSNNQNMGKVFVRDFEPRPSTTAYPDDDAKLEGYQTTFKKDFEPRPNVSAYPDDDTKLEGYQTTFKKDFESRPTVTAYSDKDAGTEKEFVKDFEPRPNLLVYQG